MALGGGGLRGLAHVGVLKALESAEIPIDYLTGTSMGGILAGLYGAGLSAQALQELGTKAGILEFATPEPHARGLLGHGKMRDYFIKVLGDEELTFEDLKIPVAMIAADVETGERVVLKEGPLIPAMLATSAFPLIFGPVRHQGHWLVDGGVVNNLPVDVARQLGADRVIGVDIPPRVELALHEKAAPQRSRLSLRSLLPFSGDSFDWKLPFLIAESSVALTIAIVNRRRLSLNPPDLLLKVDLPNMGTFVTKDNRSIIAAGEKVAWNELTRLQALRDRPLPARWRRRLQERLLRLRRARDAYRQPLHPLFP